MRPKRSWTAALTHAMLAVAEQANERLYLGFGGYLLGLALSRQDRSTEAAAQLAKSDALARQLGPATALSDWFAAARAEIALCAGNATESVALAALDPPHWDEAEAHLHESLRALEESGAALEAAQTYAVWGNLCRARGEAAAAQEHLSFAHRQFEVSGITSEL